MNYKFQTQYFAVAEKAIVLLRNRFAYREIKAVEIKHIELRNGTDVKRPTISMIFGGLLISVAIYLLINVSEIDPYDIHGGKAAKAVGYIIAMNVFLLGLGGYSIYRALPMHPVIKFSMTSGETESLSISEVIKNKMTNTLLTTLRETIGREKIKVSQEHVV